MNADERRYMNHLVERVIGAAFEVSNVLGVGFLEKVYRTALFHELTLAGLKVEAEKHLAVRYKDIIAGDYVVDLFVDNRLVVELKCVKSFANEHLAQCLNYLRATGRPLALLLNFQNPRVEVRRVAMNF